MTTWTPGAYRQMAQTARQQAEEANSLAPITDAVRLLATVVEALVDQCEQLRMHKADADA